MVIKRICRNLIGTRKNWIGSSGISQCRNFNSMYSDRYPKIPINARIVDLRSDTVTQPTFEMRKEMFEAQVGDDVYGEDPTINELERKSASIFGKEAALFTPSGTMGNLIAIMSHCDKRGAEIIVGSKSHILLFEQTGAAQVAGINIREVSNNADGTFDLEEVQMKIRDDDIHEPTTSLICVENTHNMCGGKVLPIHWLDQLSYLAKSKNIALHMDGARIFNAAIHQNLPVSRIVKNFESVSFCLSKSLGAPVGSVLVGSQQFIQKARKIRKLLGGACRQIGIVGAAGVYALDNMIIRLKDDHQRTRKIASAIREIRNVDIKVPEIDDIHTNILMIHFAENSRIDSDEFTTRLRTIKDGERESISGQQPIVVKIAGISKKVARLVVHCNISEQDVNATVEKIRYIIREYEQNYDINLNNQQPAVVSAAASADPGC